MTSNRGINIKALALGALTSIGGMLAYAAGIGVIAAIVLVAQGVPQNEVAAHMQGPIVHVLSLIFDFGFTILGGFVAGRVSQKSEVAHGGLVGLIGLVVGLLTWAYGPLWVNIVSALWAIPLGMLGGRLAAGKRQRITKDSIAEPNIAADGGPDPSSP